MISDSDMKMLKQKKVVLGLEPRLSEGFDIE